MSGQDRPAAGPAFAAAPPGTPRLLRAHHARAVLEHLRAAGPTSRPGLARNAALSKPPVSQALPTHEAAGLVARLELPDPANLIDLDDPKVLLRGRLRPSVVATRQRALTQPQARTLFERNRNANGLRWWSTYEAGWMNVTLFDRAASKLWVESVRELSINDATVIEATEFLGLIGKPKAEGRPKANGPRP